MRTGLYSKSSVGIQCNDNGSVKSSDVIIELEDGTVVILDGGIHSRYYLTLHINRIIYRPYSQSLQAHTGSLVFHIY